MTLSFFIVVSLLINDEYTSHLFISDYNISTSLFLMKKRRIRISLTILSQHCCRLQDVYSNSDITTSLHSTIKSPSQRHYIQQSKAHHNVITFNNQKPITVHTFDLSHDLEERLVHVLSQLGGGLEDGDVQIVPQRTHLPALHITVGHIALSGHSVVRGFRLIGWSVGVLFEGVGWWCKERTR